MPCSDVFVTICKVMECEILDCTLRDGAYVVDSIFGKDRIKSVINYLCESGIDIVECGWLRNDSHKKDSVFYKNPDEIADYLPSKKSEFAVMFDYGRYDLNNLTQNNGLIDIIRIAFYKKSLDEISFAIETVQSKGYKVFLQPSNIMEYSDKEIIKLVNRANYLAVNSLYIVDSFGSMFPEDLSRIIPLFSENVNKDIGIGFHSHNSLQMSLALSIQFINNFKGRNIFVDASLSGIGRGAGNTKTELLAEYLNRCGKNYDVEFLIEGAEKNITPISKEHYWEYTPQKGFKGIKGIHPNA